MFTYIFEKNSILRHAMKTKNFPDDIPAAPGTSLNASLIDISLIIVLLIYT
jgi:hypothetical protein